jgi:outer membrane protein
MRQNHGQAVREDVLVCKATSFVAAVAAACFAAAPAFAQDAAPDRVRELLAAVHAQSVPAIASPGPRVDLRLDDAVRLALERNLDIAVERLNPQTFDFSLAQIRSNYRPTLTSLFGQQSRTQAPTSQLNGGVLVTNETTTYNGGVSQDIWWGGGSLNVLWNNNRVATNNLFANFNPAFNTNFTASYTQPLLRGFRIDSTRQQLQVTRINRDISEVQLRATITNTLSNVRNAYWDLVYAVQAVEVAQRSLDLANKLVEDNRTRVEIGTMAPIDVVQAEAEAATRRQTLAQVEATWLTAELALKRLIVGGTEDENWRATLHPIDRPGFEAEPIDVEAAVRNALSKRTDLAQAKKQLESNDVSLRFLRNQTLPSVDLIATYGLQGLGGRQAIRQGSGVGATIAGYVPGGYLDALNNIISRDYPTWNFQVAVSYPVGGSPADAQYERAKIQHNQSLAQLRALELQVATEVTNAALQVQSNLRRVEAASAARALAQRRLEAETSKFEVGMSTNFFVVQAQRDLADAQNAELRALLDYRKSQVDFDRVQETSLSRAGVTVVSGGGGSTAGGTARTGGGGQGGGGF